MPAGIVLVLGPAASGKTRVLLDQARGVAGVGRRLWLAPTERAAEAVRTQLAAGGPCLAPNAFTFPDFARHVVLAADLAARPVPEGHQRLILDECIAELARGRTLSAFAAVAESPGFAAAVFSLLTELQGQGVTPQAFADAATSPKDRQLAAVFARYRERLAAAALVDRETAYSRAGELWRAGRRGPFAAVRHVFADGFLDFTPPQFALLEALAATADHLWVSLAADFKGRDERGELFQRPADTFAKLHHLAGKPTLIRLDDGDRWAPPARPAGLAHLERALFRPGDAATTADSAGVRLIEAPGPLGEARLIARAVKTLLLDGARPDTILLTARDIGPTLDLMREVFAEYGVPLELDATEPLTRDPAVATLLKAMRLADDDFPFAATTALLRSTFLRPTWDEVEGHPDVIQHAEVLLRLLGEPRGKEAHLYALRLWSREPPPGLEDERAEESRRQRKHALAVRCRPFLERFFAAWDGAPASGPFAKHLGWLRGFAHDLGLVGDSPAAERFWRELDAWAEREPQLHGRPQSLSRTRFARLAASLAASAGTPIAGRGVRLLPPEQARHVDCNHLFLYGLGERSFPQAGGTDPLCDDAERLAWRERGVELHLAADRVPDEMLLFFQLVTRPRMSLTLSYAAVDEAGQALLPSTFLAAVRECLPTLPAQKRQMLLDGFDREPPLSQAEYRIRWAMRPTGPWEASGLAPDLEAHLRDAAAVAHARFESREHSPYDGLLRHPAIVAEVAERFGPAKVFSPTALESYVECPFRFLAGQVLKLEPLDEPEEEVEQTRRGAAVHRALSRLHDPTKETAVRAPDEALGERLAAELAAAVGEYAGRVSSSAGKALWRLEGERLRRSAERYARQWAKFLEPHAKRKLALEPRHVEVDFGVDGAAHDALVVEVEGVEVRLGGRIDRLDVAELSAGGRGFWVIDYKTGRGNYYTAGDLKAMRKLQLSLYALAAERVIMADARPLGLAYWLVTGEGPRAALAGKGGVGWLESAAEWAAFRGQLEAWVATLAGRIRAGEFPLAPRSDNCTEFCDFARVCRIAQSRAVRKTWSLPLPGDSEI